MSLQGVRQRAVGMRSGGLPVRHVGLRQRGLAVVSWLLSALAGGCLQISTRRRGCLAEAVGRREEGWTADCGLCVWERAV
jgi:hypothetical protein